MKKLLSCLLLCMAVTANARETVTILWGWGVSEPPAIPYHHMVEAANKMQDKYEFVFASKMGGSGVVATEAAKDTPNTILAQVTPFFIRPNFYPKEQEYFKKYTPLLPICYSHATVVSMKYSTWKDVPTSKSLNIAYVGGVGSVHDIISYELLKKYPNARSIPFKNSVEALTGLRLGDVDLYVVPYGSVHDWGERYDIHFLGVAGSKTIDGIPTLISQGFDGIIAKAVSVHMMLVPTNVDPVKAQEWRDILTKASRSEETAKAYSIQYCNMYPIMTQKEQNDWYKDQQDSWKKLTTGIDLKE